MTTVNKNKVQNDKNIEELITALYCRLSVEDIKDEDGKKKKKDKEDESNSISNQKQILLDYCKKHGYTNTMFFVDDGISGTSFDRNDFNRMQRMVEEGKICRIIVKDLSRFGREQVEAGRLTQIVYPSLGVTFISIQENINSSTGEGMEMLPFYNIFNEWYAAQTSKKIRAVSVKGCLTIIGEYGVSFISVESRARAVCLTLAKSVCFRIIFLLSAEIKKAHGLD